MSVYTSALGGMVTADVRGPDGKDVQTWEECVRIGELLADEALRVVQDAPAHERRGSCPGVGDGGDAVSGAGVDADEVHSGG